MCETLRAELPIFIFQSCNGDILLNTVFTVTFIEVVMVHTKKFNIGYPFDQKRN